MGPCSDFTATGSTVVVVIKSPAMYSPRGNRPTSLRLTSTTSIALLDTLTRFYTARPRSSKGSPSRGGCGSARGAPWRGIFAKVSSGPCTHEQIRHSEGMCGLKWTLGGRIHREETVHSHIARRYFTAYLGVFYALQVGRHGIVRAVPSRYSCRRCPFQGDNRSI